MSDTMASRIEVMYKVADTRAAVRKEKLRKAGFGRVKDVSIADVYTIDMDLAPKDMERIRDMLTNPVYERSAINAGISPAAFDWAVEIGYLPGVTDNVAKTTQQVIEDMLKRKMDGKEGVYASQVTFVSGNLTEADAKNIGETLANPLIQRIHVKGRDKFAKDGGMDTVIPRVRLGEEPKADVVGILGAGEEELKTIGKQGISNADGSRRGPLALDLESMKAIQAHFKALGRNPTDIELESIAQTWSEHCKHTIFADPMDEIEGGIFKAYIRASTERIRKEKGDKDFCISIFKDNSGGIVFDDDYMVTDKVETHNSPSALDPFGGAITGIVGVNRDAMGFGLGAKPIINRYGFCFADPSDNNPLYKGEKFTQKMLPPGRIMEGVIEGVNVGGNCSGIPTPQGFITFDERYKGKPLVFVGTIGLIPRKSAGRLSHEKSAKPGDYIVMAGGRVGRDGVHGATFSSEAMDSGSPATAVQIGDPITQKKMSDAIAKEARDLCLYNSITDNGAGGISCSVAEMAKECGGCHVVLDDVPLKYPGSEPWEIWISESQERMTLSVPKDKWNEFKDLMDQRGVEATIIGEFNGSGRCVVEYKGKNIMDVDMGFLHDGMPQKRLETTYTKIRHEEPDIPEKPDLTGDFLSMLSRLNIASFEFISQQYDHEVQGGSVIKPLQGRGRINGDAAVTRPVLSSMKGVVTSQGLYPSYSDIDTYHMAACAIDTAIRNAIAVGADLDRIALLDNFCWCSSNEKERLGQLKAAAKACYDYSVKYGTPLISGKDSMFNDFKGYDEKGNKVKISVPPTLLISGIAVMDDSTKAISIDAKFAGYLVYVLGETNDELGGSEYFAMSGAIGNAIPKVDADRNIRLYNALSKAMQRGLVSSAKSVTIGGLAVALAKTAMAGKLGMKLSLGNLPGKWTRDDYALFSESQGRVVVTVDPKKRGEFEDAMEGNAFALLGEVTGDGSFAVKGRKSTVRADVETMLKRHKSTLGGY